VTNAGSAEIQKMAAGSFLFVPFTVTPPADITAGRLYVWLGDSSDPNNHTIEGTVREEGFLGSGVTTGTSPGYIWIRGFQIYHADEAVEMVECTGARPDTT
jgi:hypothetical protein